jgi:beta-N-acetylhexosaminidase
VKELVRRVGQRFMVGFEGKSPSPDLKKAIRDFGVGHVILFARNVGQPEQVAELVREMQEIARDAGHDRPLLVAVDQEGGRVARLREPWTLWPPLRALGRTGSEEIARRMGRALAHELSACGIRCDFAPVVDVDTNPRNPVIGDRSFGDDPDTVGRLGAAMIHGLQEGKVAACAKHFPGHGDTDLDSHLDLPAVDHGMGRLQDVELRPFRMAIEAGVATIMTAHVLVRELDDRRPATLSPRVVGELLREEMKYGGVVVSDDLEMKAVARSWTFAESAVLAAKAGCDILPVCQTPDAQIEAIEGLIRAAESGEIGTTALDDAHDRIRALKDRYLLPYRDPSPREARRAAGLGEHQAIASEIADLSGLGTRA